MSTSTPMASNPAPGPVIALLARLLNAITMFLALLGTLGVIALMLHVIADVVLRSTINYSLPATVDLVTRYYMILLALLPLGWVEWRCEMISVEVIEGVLGSRSNAALNVLVSLLSAGIYLVLTISTWGKAVEHYEIGSYIISLNTKIPVWPTHFILPFAFGLAVLVCLIRIPIKLKGIDGCSHQVGAL